MWVTTPEENSPTPSARILYVLLSTRWKKRTRGYSIFSSRYSEDGRLTDGRGATVYFTECFLIFTSNLGMAQQQGRS